MQRRGIGEYDEIPGFEHVIRKIVKSMDVHDLTFYLSYCQAMDATGLALLIRTNRDLAEVGSTVRLSRPTPEVKRVLELTRVNRIFKGMA